MTQSRILIVEDEAIIALEIESILTNLGYRVTAIEKTADKALEEVERNQPDLILMDIRIQGDKDGIDAAEMIRARFNIPIVFSTAYLDKERIDRAKVTMPFGYVLKPIQERDLKVTMEMALYTSNIEKERRLAEEKLRQHEKKMTAIFRAAPTGIGVVIDRVFVEVNQTFCDMLGYQKEEILGKSARIIYPSQEEFEYVGREKYQQIANMGSGNVETRLVKKTGQTIHVIMASTPIDMNDLSQGVTFTATDISHLKMMEQKSQRYQERLIQSAKQFKIGHWDRYMDTGEFVWSDQLYEIFGQNKATFKFGVDSHEKLIHPEDYQFFLDARREAVEEQKDVNIQYRIILPDGEIRYVHEIATVVRNAENEITRIMGVIQDITDQKQLESVENAKEEKYRRLFEDSIDGYAIGDPETGIILDCNQALADMVERHRDDLIGQHQRIIHPPENGDGEFTETFRQHTGEMSGEIIKTRIITKSGTRKNVKIRARVFSEEKTPFIHAIFKLVD